MKRFLKLLLVLTLVMSTMIFPGGGVSYANQNQIIQGELVIALEANDFGMMSVKEPLSSLEGFDVKDSLWGNPHDSGFSVFSAQSQRGKSDLGDIHLLSFSEEKYKNVNEAIRELRAQLESMGYSVKYIEPNYEVKAFYLDEVSHSSRLSWLWSGSRYSASSMHNSQRWHYEMINVPQAWGITEGSANVKIAVLDTGIDHNHQSLSQFVNTSLGKNFTTSNESDTMDRQGHGTHVAGTIASYGSVTGVMRNATLIPVKVLGDDGRGTTYGIQQGVIHAANQGADVINMSLGGGGFSQGMNDACVYAVNQGTIVIAATGNNGSGTVSYPARYDSVIAVGSVDSNRSRSSFSQYGQGLELMAPGRNIYSTIPGNRYQTNTGTSMATPHVAGVAGLMRSANPNLSVSQAREILRNTTQAAGSFNLYGYGIVDAHAALVAVTGGNGGQPTDPITVEGYQVRNVKTWTSGWWFWTTYHISGDVYIQLSDGTSYFHGTESQSSSSPNPVVNRTISGQAVAQSTGQSVPYQVNIYISQ